MLGGSPGGMGGDGSALLRGRNYTSQHPPRGPRGPGSCSPTRRGRLGGEAGGGGGRVCVGTGHASSRQNTCLFEFTRAPPGHPGKP